MNFFRLVSAFYASGLAAIHFRIIVQAKSSSKILVYCVHAASWSIPLILSVVGAVADVYGGDQHGYWCWIPVQKPALRLGLFYLYLFITSIVMFVVYGIIIVKVRSISAPC